MNPPAAAPTPTSPLRRWLPIIFWMGLIFLGSTDAASGAHTSSIVLPILRWLFHGRLSLGAMENIHLVMRKTWHVLEYAILGALLWRALSSPPAPAPGSPTPMPSLRWPAFKVILIAALYAASDEFHQSFVPSRTSSVHDVALDTLGASLGLAAMLAITRKRAN
jgi:VanZ family protein